MKHKCPKCKSFWDCNLGCSQASQEMICSDCQNGIEKPPCTCDNCQYIRRFGKHYEIGEFIDNPPCKICGECFLKHSDWHCPEKKEWVLPCGVKIEETNDWAFGTERKDYVKLVISGREGVGMSFIKVNSKENYASVFLKNSDIPTLIKALSEMERRNAI